MGLIRINAGTVAGCFCVSMLTRADAPDCFACRKPMSLTRVKRYTSGPPQMHTFECTNCGVLFIEIVTGDGPARERVSILHEEATFPVQ